jgi:hypothetical protein
MATLDTLASPILLYTFQSSGLSAGSNSFGRLEVEFNTEVTVDMVLFRGILP